jgi:hypothetical protein
MPLPLPLPPFLIHDLVRWASSRQNSRFPRTHTYTYIQTIDHVDSSASYMLVCEEVEQPLFGIDEVHGDLDYVPARVAREGLDRRCLARPRFANGESPYISNPIAADIFQSERVRSSFFWKNMLSNVFVERKGATWNENCRILDGSNSCPLKMHRSARHQLGKAAAPFQRTQSEVCNGNVNKVTQFWQAFAGGRTLIICLTQLRSRDLDAHTNVVFRNVRPYTRINAHGGHGFVADFEDISKKALLKLVNLPMYGEHI